MTALLIVLGVLAAGAVAYFLLRKPRPSPQPPEPPKPPEPEPPKPPEPEPPQPPKRLPTAFYYANSTSYGNYFHEIADLVTVYLDYEPDTPDSRKVPAGKQLYIALNIGYPTPARTAKVAIEEAIRYLRPVWDRIIALELADEPGWTTSELIANAAQVKKGVAAAGLAAKPVGATFTGKQILNGTTWKAAGLDWIGVEAYIDFMRGEKPVNARKRVTEHIKAQLDRIGGRKVVLVCQAYDRNGTWKDIGTLVAIQEPTFQAARDLGDRLVALTLFAYARPGGTKDHPELLAEHRRLLA